MFDYYKTKNKSGKFLCYTSFFICISICLIFAELDKGKYAVMFCVFLAILLAMKKINKALTFTYSFMILYACFFFKIVKFELFPQVRVLLGENVFYLISEGHPHGLRYLVAYPGILLANVFKIDINNGYTIYCLFAFAIMAAFMMDTANVIRYTGNKLLIIERNILVICEIIILSQFMNGRLVLAYTGFTILINFSTKILLKKETINFYNVILIAFSLLITTVSSGTMMVAIIYLLICLILYLHKEKSDKKISYLFLVLSPAIFFFGRYVYKMVMKNLSFFGGGISGVLKMTSHGIGEMSFEKVVMIVIVLVIAIIYLKYLKIAYKKMDTDVLLLFSIPICVVCGIFGLSTATMIIPCLMNCSLIMVKNQSNVSKGD